MRRCCRRPTSCLPRSLLILGGALACFAGYRLFRIVLGIYGFILGAMMASSMMGVTNTGGMVVAALVGGIAGALILVFAYFVGIALVGAGLGALVAHVAGARSATGDPPAVMVIVAVDRRRDRRDGAAALRHHRRHRVRRRVDGDRRRAGGGGRTRRGARGAAGDVWILYPLTPAPGQRWVPSRGSCSGLIGTGVQLGVTGRRR